MLADEMKGKIMKILGERGPMTYKEIAIITGEPPERVKRTCAALSRDRKVCIDHINTRGCVETALVIPMKEGTILGHKREGALEGAYAKGQTSFDGTTVVRTEECVVIYKDGVPWENTEE